HVASNWQAGAQPDVTAAVRLILRARNLVVVAAGRADLLMGMVADAVLVEPVAAHGDDHIRCSPWTPSVPLDEFFVPKILQIQSYRRSPAREESPANTFSK